jgi:hypothetical protein
MRRAALVLACLFAIPASAQLYKCVGADGKTGYQSEACGAAQKQDEVRVQETAGLKGDPITYRTREIYLRNVSDFRLCASLYAGWSVKHAATWDRYRQRHRAELERLEADAEFRARLDHEVEDKSRKYQFANATVQESQRWMCDNFIVRMLDQQPTNDNRRTGG